MGAVNSYPLRSINSCGDYCKSDYWLHIDRCISNCPPGMWPKERDQGTSGGALTTLGPLSTQTLPGADVVTDTLLRTTLEGVTGGPPIGDADHVVPVIVAVAVTVVAVLLFTFVVFCIWKHKLVNRIKGLCCWGSPRSPGVEGPEVEPLAGNSQHPEGDNVGNNEGGVVIDIGSPEDSTVYYQTETPPTTASVVINPEGKKYQRDDGRACTEITSQPDDGRTSSAPSQMKRRERTLQADDVSEVLEESSVEAWSTLGDGGERHGLDRDGDDIGDASGSDDTENVSDSDDMDDASGSDSTRELLVYHRRADTVTSGNNTSGDALSVTTRRTNSPDETTEFNATCFSTNK